MVTAACERKLVEPYLVAEVAVGNGPAVVSTNGAVAQGTAAVALELGGGSRSQGGHADGDGQDGLDRELHLGVYLGRGGLNFLLGVVMVLSWLILSLARVDGG